MNILDKKYSEILRLNNKIQFNQHAPRLKIKILSNIIVNQLSEILEYLLRSQNVYAISEIMNYDNIIQESAQINNEDIVLVFWEQINFFDGVYFRLNLKSQKFVTELIDRIKSEIDILFMHLKSNKLVIFNLFSHRITDSRYINEDSYRLICNELNYHIKMHVSSNVKLIDLDDIFVKIGFEDAISMKNYYSSRALYTVDFFKSYVDHVKPVLNAACGLSKKAIIFDCDNTLWSGILGEDGIDGIGLSSSDKLNSVYSEVQYLAVELSKRGVIIGLCSKNNPEDIEMVLETHPDMVLRNQHIAIKKVNWKNKVENLVTISNELNIGLDSIVFIDDSDFEVNLVREKLPEITVIQVPIKKYEYPALIRESFSLFYQLTETAEDRIKTRIYKSQTQRQISKTSFSSIEGFLRDLQIEVKISINKLSAATRISQMSQKTNQFNLTSRRYTEAEIISFMNDDSSQVISASVKDRFGDSGITALVIVFESGNDAYIDTFLMSCRVIGRNIEYLLMDAVIHAVTSRKVKAEFIATNKNLQVKGFYNHLGFEEIDKVESSTKYKLDKNKYQPHFNLDYIKVTYD